MGLSDVVSRVITKYETDTKGAERGNADMVKSFAKVTAAVGSAVAAYKALDAGLETLQHNLSLIHI